MKITDKIVYVIFILLSVVLSFFPLNLVRRFAVVLGNIIYVFIPIRKRILHTNLKLCFPKRTEKWRKKVARKCYINICIVIFEILYMSFLDEKDIIRLVDIGDLSLIMESIKKGKGLVIASGHYSNWEYFGAYISNQIPVRASCIAKTQTNLYVNKKINSIRKRFKYEAIEIGVNLREIFKRLQNNEVLMMLIDQSAHPDYSSYVDFFNVKVSSFSGAAKFALKFNTELIFAYFKRGNNLKYNFKSFKVDYSDLKGYSKENIEILTQRLQKCLEDCIREEPYQWLWFHRRFKNIKSINSDAAALFNYSDSIYR